MLVFNADSENHFLQKYRIMIHSYSNNLTKNDYGVCGAKDFYLQQSRDKITSNAGRAKGLKEAMDDAMDAIRNDRD